MAALFRPLPGWWKDSGVERWPSAGELCGALAFVLRPLINCEGASVKDVRPRVSFDGPRLSLHETALSLARAMQRSGADATAVRVDQLVIELGDTTPLPPERDASGELFGIIRDVRPDQFERLTDVLQDRAERFPRVTELELIDANAIDASAAASARPYRTTEQFGVGDVVEHRKFGMGRVIEATKSSVTVKFSVGTKKLAQGRSV